MDWKLLYKEHTTDLKKQYIPTIINLASRVWKHKQLDVELASQKMDSLITLLDKAPKPQFIAVFKTYSKTVEELGKISIDSTHKTVL
jgi:hypothetical protein